jgi:hypothetical protein
MRPGRIRRKAAEPVSSDDLDVGVDGIGQCPRRAGLVQGPVRTTGIEVGLVLGKDVRRWRSFMMRIRSSNSRRTLPTHRLGTEVLRS